LALLEHLPGSVANIVEFAIYTGFRLKNILTLKLSQVRIHESDETGEVDLYVKGGRWETKPLKLEAIAVIRRAMVGRQEGYVFISPKSGTRYTTVRKTFNRAVRKLELKTIAGDPLCFHDLRRIFATWLQEGGAGIQDINYFLGHRSLATTQRYITIDHKVMGQRLNALPSLRKSTG
ncbi:MAG: site-specific integrase, partial [Candidatus Latescibacteria bacterium]|nr:site-specific integrase [Candidatus Latescibacterota bacterium]